MALQDSKQSHYQSYDNHKGNQNRYLGMFTGIIETVSGCRFYRYKYKPGHWSGAVSCMFCNSLTRVSFKELDIRTRII